MKLQILCNAGRPRFEKPFAAAPALSACVRGKQTLITPRDRDQGSHCSPGETTGHRARSAVGGTRDSAQKQEWTRKPNGEREGGLAARRGSRGSAVRGARSRELAARRPQAVSRAAPLCTAASSRTARRPAAGAEPQLRGETAPQNCGNKAREGAARAPGRGSLLGSRRGATPPPRAAQPPLPFPAASAGPLPPDAAGPPPRRPSPPAPAPPPRTQWRPELPPPGPRAACAPPARAASPGPRTKEARGLVRAPRGRQVPAPRDPAPARLRAPPAAAGTRRGAHRPGPGRRGGASAAPLTFSMVPGSRRSSSRHRTTPSFRDACRKPSGSAMVFLGDSSTPRVMSHVTVCSAEFIAAARPASPRREPVWAPFTSERPRPGRLRPPPPPARPWAGRPRDWLGRRRGPAGSRSLACVLADCQVPFH